MIFLDDNLLAHEVFGYGIFAVVYGDKTVGVYGMFTYDSKF